MDILIITSRLGKCVVSALSDRGRNWIFNNMTKDAPITVDTEGVDDIIEMIEADGLKVQRR